MNVIPINHDDKPQTTRQQIPNTNYQTIATIDCCLGRETKNSVVARGPPARFVPPIDTAVGSTAGRHTDAVELPKIGQLYPEQSLQVHRGDRHALGGVYFSRPGGQARRSRRVVPDADLAHAGIWPVCRPLHPDRRHEPQGGDGPIRPVHYRGRH